MIATKRPNAAEVALGNALEWTIQRWVLTSGRKVRTEEAPWLKGPVGRERIGADFCEVYAREKGLEAVVDDPDAGLLTEFSELAGAGFDPSLVRPEIRGFYERTVRYGFDVRFEWRSPLRYPPRTLFYLVSRNVQQFNLPASPLVTSAGMSNEVIRLTDPATGETSYAGWLRRSTTGETILAGIYSTCGLPGRDGRFFKGVYPLPDGSVTVIFRPENRPDGSFALVSDGRRFGDEGYYRLHRASENTLRVQCVLMRESIHLFVDEAKTLRSCHTFAFCGVRFLTMRYKIMVRFQARTTSRTSPLRTS